MTECLYILMNCLIQKVLSLLFSAPVLFIYKCIFKAQIYILLYTFSHSFPPFLSYFSPSSSLTSMSSLLSCFLFRSFLLPSILPCTFFPRPPHPLSLSLPFSRTSLLHHFNYFFLIPYLLSFIHFNLDFFS